MRLQPPGPKGHWLLGNLNEFQSNPLECLTNAGQIYGDFFSLRLGPVSVYVVNHPDLVHQVLVEDAAKFHKSSMMQQLRKTLGNGLVLSEDDFWKRQRKLIQPAFHAKRIGGYGQVMVDYTLDMLERWKSGATYDLDAEMSELTMRIIAKTIFDTETKHIADQVGAAMITLQNSLADRFRSPLHLPDWLPTEKNKAVKRAIATLDRVIWSFIDERRTLGEDKGDLLSMLLLAQDDEGKGMSEQQLRDEVITLFLAGHETTAKTLAWAFYAISQHPEVELRLMEELDTVLAGRAPTLSDLANLPYTEMVIKETLRLYPAAWIVSREPIEDVTIGGYPVKQGSMVFISPYLAHQDERYYPQPEQFIPDRFTPDEEKSRPHYAYFPFGGGPRICIGNNFALMEARLILATIMQNYQLTVAPGHQVEAVPLLTLVPKDGMPMVTAVRQQSRHLAVK